MANHFPRGPSPALRSGQTTVGYFQAWTEFLGVWRQSSWWGLRVPGRQTCPFIIYQVLSMVLSRTRQRQGQLTAFYWKNKICSLQESQRI